MNDELRNALRQLHSDVPEAGVWEEIQGRVNTRRRRNRAIQGALGLIAVLAIGLGASGLLRGSEGPDFVEQPGTTAVEAPTTTTTAGTEQSQPQPAQPSSRLYGPLSPWYTVADTITVSGELADGETVLVLGRQPEIVQGTYFEAEVELVPGLNEIEVRFTKPDDVAAVQTLEITQLQDAVDQFAFIREFSGELVFDEAELLTGEAATKAAREAGEIGEAETLPNDYFIRNSDPTLSSLVVADYAVISLLGFDDEGSVTPILVDRDEFEAMFAGNFDPGGWYGGDPRTLPYWLIIEGYRIVQIEQQYLP